MSERTQISDSDPMIGRTILEFRVEEKLAEGGMGAVYLGRHVRLPSVLKVIKVLLPAYATNPVLRRRFHREAEAASKLGHACILRIDNFGELPDGQLFLMVPYLEGKPLDVYLRARGGRLVPHRALHLLVQLCDALDHAHTIGIVHRDLKPSNVYLVSTNVNPYAVRLLDFGVAKFLGESADSGTHSGVAIGTPSYMAVEQYEHGDEVTPLADVYSLAVMTWELVTGRLPWQHADRTVLYHMQRTVVPKRPPPSEMPLEWSRLLLAALSVDLIVRPRSVRELAMGLASALPAEGRMPSGTEILAALAPHFVRKARPGDDTVRNAADSDRMAPLLWLVRETAEERARLEASGLAAVRELPAAREAPEVPPAASRPPGAPGTGRSGASRSRAGQSSERGARQRARRKLAFAAVAAMTVAGAGIAARAIRSVAPEAAKPKPEPEAVAAALSGAGPELAAARRGAGADPSGTPVPLPAASAPADVLVAPASESPALAPPAQAAAPQRLGILGELGVYVAPYAMVFVDGRWVGQTPYRARLPSGSYRVRMKNEESHKDEVVTVTIAPGARATVRRTW